MKSVLIFLSIMLLASSCSKPECPEGQTYECGKGCVSLQTTSTTVEVVSTPEVTKPELDHDLVLKSKYSLTTKVCILGKWSGVVTDFWWGASKADVHEVIVYDVEYLVDDKFEHGEFYDTQLERGECQ